MQALSDNQILFLENLDTDSLEMAGMTRLPPESWLDLDDGLLGAYMRKDTSMKGWRTLAFNLALVGVGVLQAFDWTSVLGSAPYVGWIVTGIGVLGTVLRTQTTGPVGTKL